MTVKLSLEMPIKPTGRAVCDRCHHAMVYTGNMRTEGRPLTDPDRRIDGGGPLPLICPWCNVGTLRYQR